MNIIGQVGPSHWKHHCLLGMYMSTKYPFTTDTVQLHDVKTSKACLGYVCIGLVVDPLCPLGIHGTDKG